MLASKNTFVKPKPEKDNVHTARKPLSASKTAKNPNLPPSQIVGNRQGRAISTPSKFINSKSQNLQSRAKSVTFKDNPLSRTKARKQWFYDPPKDFFYQDTNNTSPSSSTFSPTFDVYSGGAYYQLPKWSLVFQTKQLKNGTLLNNQNANINTYKNKSPTKTKNTVQKISDQKGIPLHTHPRLPSKDKKAVDKAVCPSGIEQTSPGSTKTKGLLSPSHLKGHSTKKLCHGMSPSKINPKASKNLAKSAPLSTSTPGQSDVKAAQKEAQMLPSGLRQEQLMSKVIKNLEMVTAPVMVGDDDRVPKYSKRAVDALLNIQKDVTVLKKLATYEFRLREYQALCAGPNKSKSSLNSPMRRHRSKAHTSQKSTQHDNTDVCSHTQNGLGVPSVINTIRKEISRASVSE